MTDHGLRTAIDRGDVDAVRAIVAEHPDALNAELDWRSGNWGDTSRPLNYVSLARFHALADHDVMAEIAAVLISAGAAVDGPAGTEETPLITAASYGEAEVARVLIDAGADLEAVGVAVDDASALGHAVYYGNSEVADLLVSSGARVRSLAEAAGAGRLGERVSGSSEADRAEALRAAAVCERLEVLDELLNAGVDIEATTENRTALQWAGYHGKASSARYLVERGADPHRADPEFNATALRFARFRHRELYRPSPGHDEVETYLGGLEAAGSL